MSATTCPSHERVQALMQGMLSLAEAEELSTHVESCARCAQTVAQMEDDTLVNALRAGAHAAAAPMEAHLQQLLERLCPLEACSTIQPGPTGDAAATPVAEPESDWSAATGPLEFLEPAQSADELGRLGGFRILRRIGAGGMGLVFEAEEMQLERRVAVKVMKPELARKEQQRERFLREARSAAKVLHDHLCPIYSVTEVNGLPVIAMPLLRGEPLDHRVRRDGFLPWPEAVRLGREIALGLAAAHAAGLIHRDIKPGNIWLEAGQTPGAPVRVKILDFGLARPAGADQHLTQSGVVLGTPAYMAPEQARGQAVDQRADLFSLGVLLYEMTTGRRPFTGPDTIAILSSLALDEPAPPSAVRPGLPEPLSAFILQLLQKSPDGRPQRAEEVVRRMTEIASLCTPEPTTLPTPAQDLPQARGPRRMIVALLICLLAMAALAFAADRLIFTSENGTLIVDVDGDADLRFAKGKLLLYDDTGKLLYELTPSERNKNLPKGKYLVKVIGADGVALDTDQFEITRAGAKVRVSARTAGPASDALPPRFTNSLGMQFVLVPAGKAWLGGGGGTIGANQAELPDAFYLGTHEVTQEEWTKLRSENPSSFARTGRDQAAVQEVADVDLRHLPVENVSYKDVQAFLRKLNALDQTKGWTYRLPTEAEWEYACRGGPMADLAMSSYDGYFERPVTQLQPHLANYRHDRSPNRTLAVGSFPANPLGLRDMLGNVWEWCETPAMQGDTLGWRLRGGSFTDAPVQCRAAAKGWARPHDRSRTVGFRIARVPIIDHDRRAAEYVLSIGGKVLIKDRGIVGSLAELPKEPFELWEVYLRRNDRFTDEQLTVFSECRNLRNIDFVHTRLSDAGLVCFRNAKRLIVLDLVDTRCGDQGLAWMGDLPNLAYLWLGMSRVTDAGLKPFARCQLLRNLDVSKTGITDEGLLHFQGCTSLHFLSAFETKVTDAGLAAFKDCKVMEFLHLDGTAVTDKLLEQLKTYKHLKVLTVKATQMKEPALRELKAVLPACRIIWDGPEMPPR